MISGQLFKEILKLIIIVVSYFHVSSLSEFSITSVFLEKSRTEEVQHKAYSCESSTGDCKYNQEIKPCFWSQPKSFHFIS